MISNMLLTIMSVLALSGPVDNKPLIEPPAPWQGYVFQTSSGGMGLASFSNLVGSIVLICREDGVRKVIFRIKATPDSPDSRGYISIIIGGKTYTAIARVKHTERNIVVSLPVKHAVVRSVIDEFVRYESAVIEIGYNGVRYSARAPTRNFGNAYAAIRQFCEDG